MTTDESSENAVKSKRLSERFCEKLRGVGESLRCLFEFISVLAVPLFLAFSLVAPFAPRLPFIGDLPPRLEIVAKLVPQDGKWVLRGRVLQDGNPVEKAQVWAVVKDKFGQRGSLDAVK